MGNYTRWYRVGNVKLVNGSRTVEGTDTYWLTAGLNPGDLFTIDGAQFYEVDTITDNTHLTLKNTYAGVSDNDSQYSIIRNFTATMPADIAARTSELLGDFRKYIDTDMRSIHGESAYELAVQNGYVGTEREWLDSLKAAGEFLQMKSALESYQVSTDDRVTALETGQGTLSSLNTSAKTNLVAAINGVLSNQGTLSTLSTSTKTTLVAAVNELVSHQGSLSSLSTSAKNTLVAAINEVLSYQGALSSLTTTAKTTLVAAVNELQTRTAYITEARSLGNAGFAHNLIYRGKCLGDKPTAAQLAAIADGTFDDMYLGDYWTGVGNSGWTGLHWMIVHFNYYSNEWGNHWMGVSESWLNNERAAGWTTTHWAPHVTVMQMKSATASAALNQKGGRLDLEKTDRNQYFEYGDGTTRNYDAGEGGYNPKVIHNALVPTFGGARLFDQHLWARHINDKGQYIGTGYANFCAATYPYYSQLTGLDFPSSDYMFRKAAASGAAVNDRQFAAFKAAPFFLNNNGLGTANGKFWLRDMIGPNSSGVAQALLCQPNGCPCFVPKPITYSDAQSTYHVYATIM